MLNLVQSVVSSATGLECAPTWPALTSDSGAGVAIISEQGIYLYANNEYARLYGFAGQDLLVGKSLRQVFPEPAAEERSRIIRDVVETGQPTLKRAIWRGVRLRAVIRTTSIDHGTRAALVTVRPERASDRSAPVEGMRVIDMVHVDKGRLADITKRELQILELIGSGLTIESIAHKLGRSRKTVENQRQSMGQKLGVHTRAELVRIAIECGLVAPGGTS